MKAAQREESVTTLASTLLGTYEVLSPSIRRAYLAQIDAKLHRLQLVSNALESNPGDQKHLREIYRLFHNLAGSAGCYGFPQVTAIAQQCMRVVKEQVQSEGRTNRQTLRLLNESLSAISACFKEVREADDELLTSSVHDALDADADHPEASVLLLGSGLTREVAAVLRRENGIACHHETDAAHAEQVMRSVRPSAIVADASGEQHNLHSVLSAARSAAVLRSVPVVVIGGPAAVIAELRALELGPVISAPASASANEIAELVRGAVEMRRSAAEDAVRDELTGTYNARYFREQLERELRRARRYHHPLSLAVIEVDHLENYAAVYGASASDSVLVAFAGFLSCRFRDADLVARVNGGAFAVLMPETGLKHAQKAVARNLEELKRASLPIDQNRLQVSVAFSAGVSSYPANAEQAEDLIEQTYDALYRAKDAGGDRVYVARRRTSVGPAKRGGQQRPTTDRG